MVVALRKLLRDCLNKALLRGSPFSDPFLRASLSLATLFLVQILQGFQPLDLEAGVELRVALGRQPALEGVILVAGNLPCSCFGASGTTHNLASMN